MKPNGNSVAFGPPGIEPRWPSSAKEGVGTASHTGCRLWFTPSHGIVNEVHYPRVDPPNTRDFQFLITDGETFCDEEKRDLTHEIEYPEPDCVFYRRTHTQRRGRYRLVSHVLTDPHHSVLLVHTKVEVLDASLPGKVRLYALLALLANVFAQARALAFGKTPGQAKAEGTPDWLVPHRVLEGSRPSNVLLAERLTPELLGCLVALYEHSVFTQGVIWNIDPFDQWGVKLGKALAQRIIPELVSPTEPKLNHDNSTDNLIRRYRNLKGTS